MKKDGLILNCSSLLLISALWIPVNAIAQITSDETLSTTVNSSDGNNFTIDNGNRVGNNLFHSFKEFSVPTNGSAFFNNAVDIDNIISRVTGGNVSNIDGLIKANGSANLFLINPAGILFGNNARLNIGGSFLGSTADSLLFPDGEFSATDLNNSPLLTINVPIGLGISNNPGDIVNQSISNNSNGLEVSVGENITLVGGDLNLNGGRITAPGGRVELGGLSAAGEIGINADGSLSFPAGIERADVSLTNQAVVNVLAGGGGSIDINARNLTLSEQSELLAGIAENMGSPDAKAGNIMINAEERILISQASAITNQVEATATGNSGDIELEAGSVIIRYGSLVSASTLGSGDGGNVKIIAQDSVVLEGNSSQGDRSQIQSQVGRSSIGNAGNIEIETGSLILKDGARFNTGTTGIGHGGSVKIIAQESVLLEGKSRQEQRTDIVIRVGKKARGNAGKVEIETGSLTIKDGAELNVGTAGKGNGGSIKIIARESVLFAGESRIGKEARVTDIFSRVGAKATGNAGNIEIETGSLTIKDGAQLNSGTEGKGNGGDIKIIARDSVLLEGESTGRLSSFIVSQARKDSIGKAGNIEIETGSLTLKDGAILSAGTGGRGNAGFVKVIARESVLVQGISGRGQRARINSRIGRDAIGDAGGVEITTGSLILKDGGRINTEIAGVGKAGSITINADTVDINTGSELISSTFSNDPAGDIKIQVKDSITITGKDSGIFANTASESTGVGGDIEVTTVKLNIQELAEINVSAEGAGEAGSLNIKAQDITLDRGSLKAETGRGEQGNITLSNAETLLLSNNSSITTNATESATGGNITINSDGIALIDNSDITAQAEDGRGGNIQITTQRLFQEPDSIIDASSQRNIDGTVTINSPDVDPTSGLVELPSVTIDAEAILAQDLCKFEDEKIAKGSSFIITGRGGLTPTSADPLENLDSVVRWANQDDIEVSKNGLVGVRQRPESETSYPVIQQAQGWVTTSDGKVWLVANAPETIPQHSKIVHPDCRTLDSTN